MRIHCMNFFVHQELKKKKPDRTIHETFNRMYNDISGKVSVLV